MPSTRLPAILVLLVLVVSLFTPTIMSARTIEFQAFLNLLEEKLGRILPPNVPVLAIFLVSGKPEDLQMFSFAAIKGLYALSQWLGYESPKTIEWFRKLQVVPVYKTFTLNGVEVTSIPILTSYGSVVELAEKLRDRLLALVVKPIPKLETLPLDDQTLNMLLRDGLVLSNYDVRQLIGVSKVEEIYGITGAGVPVAVVDTGVDYGHPDLKPALAYYEGFYNGVRIREPLVLDADEILVVFFTPIKAVNGYLDVSGKYFYTHSLHLGGKVEFDNMTIKQIFGCTKFYVGGIPSASGNYMLGFIVEWTPSKVFVYPVLMYDPEKPGVYTELRIDFNLNCNFADDKPVSYYGDRVLVYDEDGDGYPEVSLGVAGGFFYDWLGLVSETPAILPGWDLGGRYLSIFYDWDGHGTACASAIAGRGVVVPASVAPKDSLFARVVKPQPGMARDAKIVGISGLLVGTEIGLLWAAGFDIAPDGTIRYSGKPRAKIISNSWGALPIYEALIQLQGAIAFAPARVEGLDYIAMLENMLSTPGLLDPSYPGVLIVQAAGNGGPGYGTVVTPAAAHRILTVGASTSYAYVKDIRGYGSATADDIAFFSARGPTPLGWVKPDVVNVGWASWTAAPIWAGGFDLFGGTSYATPLTAGVAALIYQVLPDADPQLVKQIIMSTADNIGYDVYSMGAGRVNAFKAVSLALELAGRESRAKVKPLIAYSVDAEKYYLDKVYHQWVWNAKSIIELMLNLIYIALEGKAKLKFKPYSVEPNMVKQYSLYIPDIEPGSTRETSFTIYNPTSKTAKLDVGVYWEKLVLDYEYNVTLQPIDLDTIYTILVVPVDKLVDIDLLKVVFTVPYEIFDREHDYEPDYRFFLRLFGWKDVNGNGKVEIGELKYAGFSFQLSNQLVLAVSKPWRKLGDCDYLIINVTGMVISGVSGKIPAKIHLLGYKIYSKAEWVSVTPTKTVLDPHSSKTFKVVVSVPKDADPIAYQAWIVVSYDVNGYKDVITIPLSFTVYKSVDRLTFLEDDTGNPYAKLYSPYAVYGAYNWAWWFEAGDWRYYYVYVDGRRFGALAYTVFWDDKWTCITTYAVDPLGSFGGLGAVLPAIYNWIWPTGVFAWTAVVRPGNVYSTPTATISLRGHVFSVPSIDGGRVMAGVATIAVHAVLFDGGKSFSRIRLSLLPIIYARSLPDTITAHGVYNEHIVVPYKGFYSSMVVPKVLSLGDVEMLLSLTIPLAISSPSGITEVPLKPVNEIFSEASVVVRAYGSPKPLWIALVVPITDTRFNLVMVYDGETLETYNLVWFEEASLIR